MLSLKEYIAQEEQMIIEEEEKKSELRSKVIDFFTENDSVNDDEFHKFADSLGLDSHNAENIVYELMTEFWSKGKYTESSDVEINKDELEMGVDVEMEHTSSPEIARKIALDHLAEITDYYTRLKEMESQATGNQEE